MAPGRRARAPPAAAGRVVIDHGPQPALPISTAHPVWLVRHAATTRTGRRWCGRADPALSTAGRAAADALARRLVSELAPEVAPEPARAITLLVSPARRARQTASPIAGATGAPIEIDRDLLEVDVGDAEGLTWVELEARHPDIAAQVAAGLVPDWPGGESREALGLRARRAATRIRSAAAAGPVVVVSHGALLHVLAAELAHVPIGPRPAVPPPAIFPLGPGGVLRMDPR